MDRVKRCGSLIAFFNERVELFLGSPDCLFSPMNFTRPDVWVVLCSMRTLMSGTSISSLVVRAQTGDRATYDRIVHRFQDMAVGYARSLLGDFHLAEDGAQEAFVGAWIEWPKQRDPAAFSGWFRRMVFMRCSRLQRRRHRAVERAGEEVLPLAAVDPGEVLASRDEKAWGLGAIGRLSEEERMATTLFYISAYSHPGNRRIFGFAGGDGQQSAALGP